MTTADIERFLEQYSHIINSSMSREAKAGYLAAAAMVDPNAHADFARMGAVKAWLTILDHLPH
jgi:hypothetical protein